MRGKTNTALALAAIVAAFAGRAPAETTVVGNQGPSTTQTSYLIPVAAGVRTVSILTAGDTVNPKLDGATNYRMVGIPDGAGAIDLGDGTMLLTSNHEINSNSAVARTHGSSGAFVSAWRIDRTTLRVRSGYDLIRTVELWNAATQIYAAGTTSFDRFCSADVPAQSAFFDQASGLGTTERFHMNGEESGTGRAMAHQMTGVNAGVSWELPKLGKQGWENVIACPFAQVKTIVAATDDTGPTPGGQVYVYVGNKQAAGTDIQKAGLSNGILYGVAVPGVLQEDRVLGIGVAKATATSFTLAALPDQSAAGANVEAAANTALVTKFLRPEDGAWDPVNPADFYFVTTDQFSTVKSGTGSTVGNSRLWRLRFSDITNPTAGGNITMMLDGSEPGQMYDNICIDRLGHVILEEDVGGNAHNGKIWQFAIGSGALTLLAKHDPARFGDQVNGVNTPATSPFNNDEEGTGIFDASDLLGPGWFVSTDQAHYSISGELFQGGQFFALFNPDSVAAPTITAAATANPALPIVGQSVAFDVTASILGDAALTYSWSFGDGTNAPGRSVSHAYTTAGVFTATVTATHAASGKSAQSSVQVDVGRPMGTFDVIVSLNFSQTGKDSVNLTGEAPIPAGYDPAGRQITLDVGGVVRTFTMDALGNANPNANESFKLQLRRNTDGSVPAQHGFFQMILLNGDFRSAFVDEGFTSRNATNEPGAVALVVTFNGHTDRAVRDVLYNAQAGKKAIAR